MPWTPDNPPSPPVDDDWTQKEIEACVSAANAVLDDGGSEEEAIQACVHAAGKSKEDSLKDILRKIIYGDR